MRIWAIDRRTAKLLWIGQISSYFALLILTVRNFLMSPASGYLFVAIVLFFGFLPSSLLVRLFRKATPYVLILNALGLICVTLFSLHDWSLSGGFIIAPVFSLLFRDSRAYLVASVASLIAASAFSLNMLLVTHDRTDAVIMAVNVVTVSLITVFILYVVVRDVLQISVEEAKLMQTISALTRSVEARDQYTQGHSDRVAGIARLLAQLHPQGDPEVAYSSGLIHDVGKLSIPDAILLKPGRLTEAEFAAIRRHPADGADICRSLGISEELIAGVRHHHERWDGKGYPDGLSGQGIPLVGRIIGVADALDAMASHRAYRAALDMQTVHEELLAGSGSQFDPQVASLAVQHWERILDALRSARELPQTAAGAVEVPG